MALASAAAAALEDLPTVARVQMPPSPPTGGPPKVRRVLAIGDAAERAHSDPTEMRVARGDPVALVPIQPGGIVPVDAVMRATDESCSGTKQVLERAMSFVLKK